MSEAIEADGARTERDADDAAARDELVAQLELLKARNRKLRRQQRENYRNTARGLVGVALLSLAGAVVFPPLRELLVALGVTGLFAAVLTYYVTPDHVIASETGERVYGAFAETTASLVRQLGLSESRVYVPTDGTARARLFVPQYGDFELPSAEALESPLVIAERERQRGVSLRPTGAALLREVERTLAEPLASSPEELVPQLRDGLTETLELASRVEGGADSSDGQLSFRVADSVWEGVERVDHPVPSFLAVGCAVGLDTPVEAEVVPVREGDADAIVRVSWSE
ncbi:hypothetical protein [Halogeometricum sp. CBA1124]|uniref:hypothetical protein n=1 Tax=Halogeometricum sp. CBA1124 TaxID=2668071 RepID=UPI00142B1189|nr:hypothetical protein [Halogeometricum sp. CBA1124]MUV57102.1 hypothetical protein [Halogeometricum sp. CBA1124]